MKLRLKETETRYRVAWFTKDKALWKEMLDLIKSLPSSSFSQATKEWLLPKDRRTTHYLQRWGYFTGKYTPIIHPPKPYIPPWKDMDLDTSKAPYLYPYQVDTMRFLTHNKGSGLIADTMGLGKTVQALGWASLHPKRRPLIIITTSSTKQQWARAVMQFNVMTPSTRKDSWGVQLGTPLILYGQSPQVIPQDTEVIIINWEILTYWLDQLLAMEPQIIVADECQAMGNPQSLRTRAAQQLVRKSKANFIPMSGTPIKTSPMQFWAVLNLLDPELFPNYNKYLWRYCNPQKGYCGWTFKGSSNEAELFEKVNPLMIRRSEEVLNLAPKVISVVPVEQDSSLLSEYKAQERSFESGQASREHLELQAELESLSNTAYALREKGTAAWIKDWLENTDKPLLIFAWHRAVVETLKAELHKYKPLTLDGSTPSKQRELNKLRFVEGHCRVLIANIISGGVGLDGLQQVCQDMVFVEFAPSPEDHNQAEARLFRNGQKGTVRVNYLIAEGTIDEQKMRILDERRAMISEILDGKTMEDSGSFLTHLLGKVKKRK